MLARSLTLTLFAFAASVLAKTQNMDPQYALLTLTNEYQLAIYESLINATDASQMSKFTPVKAKIHTELVSGKADLTTVAIEVGEMIQALDKSIPGIKDAALKYASKNKLDMYSINSLAPDASWDFVYAACKRAATELKADKILTSLEKLNDDLEETLKSGKVDIKAVVEKIDAFTNSAKEVSLMFSDYVVAAGDMEIEKYQDKLQKLQRGEKLPAETQAAKEEEEKPQASAGSASASTSTNETVAATMTEAPAATTATTATTVAPTKAPAATSGVSGTTLSVAASVVTMAVAYLVL